MISEKLWSLLQSLSEDEVRRLRKFLRSPYLHQHDDTAKLGELLLKGLSYPRERYAFTWLHQKLFPERVYQEANLRHLCSYLQKAILKFLAVEELMQKPNLPETYTLQALRRRGQHKLFEMQQNKWQKQKASRASVAMDAHLLDFLVAEEFYHDAVVHTKEVESTLQTAANQLDRYYVAHKLRHACHLHAYTNMRAGDHELLLLSEALSLMEDNPWPDSPVVTIYFKLYQALRSTDEANAPFAVFKEVLATHGPHFPTDELRSIYLLAINHCIRQLNTGKAHYLREAFTLYSLGLERDVLLVGGELTPWTYKNIVSAGLKLDELDWTDHFIEQYAARLDPAFREAFHSYNKAHLHYHRGQLREASHLLSTANISDLVLQLGAKVLLAKCYYGLGKIDLLSYQLNNFRHLIRNRKITTYHRDNYTNFITIMHALTDVTTNDKASRNAFRAQVEAADILTERGWFLEQISEA